MSLSPFDEAEQSVVQRSDLKPVDPKDKPSAWRRFFDDLRTALGMKPLYLCERWAEAKVRKVEVVVEADEADNQIKLLKARQDYEEAMARVRQMDREGIARAKKVGAEAKFIDAQSRELNMKSRVAELVLKMIQAHGMSPYDARKWLVTIIEQIHMAGGGVEVDVPKLPPAPAVTKVDRYPKCAACSGVLDLHQPDSTNPTRLIGTCPSCHHWYVVAYHVETGTFTLVGQVTAAKLPAGPTQPRQVGAGGTTG